VTTSSEAPREERIMSDDMESASLLARKTSQSRETLRCWVVAGFEYAARVTATRETDQAILCVETSSALSSTL
jgi:hypothetical protein